MQRLERLAFWQLIGLTAATRLGVALAGHHALVNSEVYSDDAFYYLKIAQNLASGRGLTFDGVSVTNGFHPLYLGLLVPIFKLGGGDLVWPIHASAVLLSLFAVATGLVVFRLTEHLAGPRSALAALALWAVSPYFIAHGVNGLETGLGLFFAALAVWLYLLWFRSRAAVSAGRCVLTGIVWGLALLARIDLALVLAAITVDWALGESFMVRFKRIAAVALVAALTWLPWGLVSHAETGHWLPLSGAASRRIALEVGGAVDLPHVWSVAGEDPLFDPEHPPAAYYGDVLTKMTFLFLLESPLLAPLRSNLDFSIWPDVRLYQPFAWLTRSPVLGSALLALILLLVARQRPRGLARICLVYLVFFALGYTFYCPSQWYYSRYLTTLVLLSTVAVLARRRMRWPLVLLFTAAFGLQLRSLASFYSWLERSDTPFTGRLERWTELRSKMEPSLRIGAFQAGVFSYFGGLDVIDLDGKVNQDAYRALREHRLHRYIYQQGIGHIVEWEWLFYALCLRHTPVSELSLKRIDRGRGPFDLTLYRVVPLPPAKDVGADRAIP